MSRYGIHYHGVYFIGSSSHLDPLAFFNGNNAHVRSVAEATAIVGVPVKITRAVFLPKGLQQKRRLVLLVYLVASAIAQCSTTVTVILL